MMSIRFISVVLMHLVARILAVVSVALLIKENVGILRILPYRFKVWSYARNGIVIVAIPFFTIFDVCIVVT